MKPLLFPNQVSIPLVWDLGFGQKAVVCPAALWSYLHVQRASVPFKSFIDTLNLHHTQVNQAQYWTALKSAEPAAVNMLLSVLCLATFWCWQYRCAVNPWMSSTMASCRRVRHSALDWSQTSIWEVGLEIWVVALKSYSMNCWPKRSGKLAQGRTGSLSIKGLC